MSTFFMIDHKCVRWRSLSAIIDEFIEMNGIDQKSSEIILNGRNWNKNLFLNEMYEKSGAVTSFSIFVRE